MRNQFDVLRAVCVAGFVFVGTNGLAGKYTITGSLEVYEWDWNKEGFVARDSDSSESTTSESDSAPFPNREETEDWTSATIVVSHQETGQDGNTSSIELASGTFVDRKISIEGEVNSPMEIEVSARVGGETKLSTLALLQPGGEAVDFALLDYRTPDLWPRDQLVLVGSSRASIEPSKKFVVQGDLGGINRELTNFEGFLTILATLWITDYINGEPQQRKLSEVKLEDESFLIEADIDEPRAIKVLVQGTSGISSSVDAVIEPRSNVEVSWHGSTDRLVATSDSKRHVKLVERWQQTDEYTDAMDKYTVALEAYFAEWKELEEAAKSGEDPNAQSNLENFYSRETYGQFEVLESMSEMRSAALQDIALNTEDPIDTLLAMEMGAFSPRDNNRSEAFRIYDKLADVLDKDLVSRRVAPMREKLVWFIRSEENDQDLMPGLKVPEFTLSNLEGTEIELYDVLEENDIVLVEFWASWCGPCVSAFEHLKRLHAEHNENGFEVVSVSIDQNFDDWSHVSKEHGLPWIDLGELEGWDGRVATSYGVQFIPKGYLLDSEGMVLEKDLKPHLLEERLEERFGNTQNPSNSEPEM